MIHDILGTSGTVLWWLITRYLVVVAVLTLAQGL
jgi:hypothetical protein